MMFLGSAVYRLGAKTPFVFNRNNELKLLESYINARYFMDPLDCLTIIICL